MQPRMLLADDARTEDPSPVELRRAVHALSGIAGTAGRDGVRRAQRESGPGRG